MVKPWCRSQIHEITFQRHVGIKTSVTPDKHTGLIQLRNNKELSTR